MSVFVDTSAFLALLDADEAGHERVREHEGTSLLYCLFQRFPEKAIKQGRPSDAPRGLDRTAKQLGYTSLESKTYSNRAP